MATRRINKLPPVSLTKAMRPGMHSDGGGLYLQVSESGAKSWIFRYSVNGKAHYHGLGPLQTVSLAQAREKAKACRHLVLDGIDPIAARRAKRNEQQLAAAKAITFRQCAEAYIQAHAAGWRNSRHAAQWPATLETYVYPVFGPLPVQAIDVGLVMKVLEPLWVAKPETASRVRGRIEAVLDWATARAYRQGENPARWRGHLENLLPKKSKVRRVEHHAALPYAELPAFMAELRQQGNIAARALEFLILTAARTGEVRGALWAEIDLKAHLWIIPAERTKAHREHRVPLSNPAAAILEALVPVSRGELIFPSDTARGPIGNARMLRLLARMGRGHLTAHGFRSTFSDWCSECTHFPSEVREMALAHAINSQVEAAYRRGDLFQKRRDLMDAWARHCSCPTDVPTAIIPFPATG
jgi:integrase